MLHQLLKERVFFSYSRLGRFCPRNTGPDSMDSYNLKFVCTANARAEDAQGNRWLSRPSDLNPLVTCVDAHSDGPPRNTASSQHYVMQNGELVPCPVELPWSPEGIQRWTFLPVVISANRSL